MDPISRVVLMSGSGPGFVPSGNGFIIEYGGTGSSNGYKLIHDLTTDSSGNIYICGEKDPDGNSHALVAKFNSSGVIQYQKDFDTYNGDFVFKSIHVDSSGNIHLGGSRRLSSVSTNAFQYTKLNSSFVEQVQKDQYKNSASTTPEGVLIDSSGNYYYFGKFSGDFWYSKVYGNDHSINTGKQYDTSLTTSQCLAAQMGTNGDAAITFYTLQYVPPNFLYKVGIGKLGSTGSVSFSKYVTTTNIHIPYAITTDSSSNIYCAGQTDSQGTSDGWIIKTNSSGSVQWERYIGGSGSERFYSVKTDSSGNVYAVGTTNTGFSSTMMLLVKYNSSGTLQWQRTFSYSGGLSNYRSGLDHRSSKIYVGGARGSGTNTAVVLALPDDGSETGSFYGYTYASSSLSNGSVSNTTGTLSLSGSTPSPQLTMADSLSTETTLSLGNQVKDI
jgi:hypothetical protein